MKNVNMTVETIVSRHGRPKDGAKREEIVMAATHLFLQNGYELTSMEAVAKQAGVSKLTIYSHFADKSELFRAIMAYRCDQMKLPRDFTELTALPPEQALTQIAATVAAIIFREDSIRLQRIIHAEAVHHPEVVKSFYESGPKRIRVAFADLLRAYDERGTLAIPDAALATEQFFSVLKGEKLIRTLLLMAPVPTEAEIAAHVRNTVTFFLAAYRPCLSSQETDKK
ncbi:MAG: TetR/AcrR family transcriptional regulator [Alphaproteobacteria bacterium]|nr:TetR/AcrR family transcriptional regulator [Alphaproteobacteria bacterium]